MRTPLQRLCQSTREPTAQWRQRQVTIHRLRSSQGADITITHTVVVRDDSGLFHESVAQNVVVSVGKAGAHGVGGAFMPNTRQSDQPDITYAPGQSLSFSPQAGVFVCNLADIVFQSATAGGSAF